MGTGPYAILWSLVRAHFASGMEPISAGDDGEKVESEAIVVLRVYELKAAGPRHRSAFAFLSFRAVSVAFVFTCWCVDSCFDGKTALGSSPIGSRIHETDSLAGLLRVVLYFKYVYLASRVVSLLLAESTNNAR